MRELDRNDLKILEHFDGDWKQLKTLEELSKSTVYRKKDELLEEGLLDEKPREGEPGNLYKTTEKGARILEESTLGVEGVPQARLAPTPEHRAMIELILAATVSRQTRFRTDHHPTFVQVGKTLKWKTWLAKYVSHLLGLDPDDTVILMSSESGRSLLTRRGYGGETISQRDVLDMPFVCFDEYHEATKEQRKLARVYMQGRVKVPYENQDLEIKPVPLLNLNPQGTGGIREKTGLEERQVRRSVICDLDRVDIPDSKKAIGEEILGKVKGESIAIPDQVPDLSTHRDWIQKTINECVREDCKDLVDLEMLTLLASGMANFIGEREAVVRTVRDYLQVVETLDWTREGWPRIMNLLTDELGEKTRGKGATTAPAYPRTLAQQALANTRTRGSANPLDYDAKLARLMEKLRSHGLESDGALTTLKELERKCDEEGVPVAETVDRTLNLLNTYEDVDAAVQSKKRELSNAEEELGETREERAGLESKIEDLQEEIGDLEARRNDVEEGLAYTSDRLTRIDDLLQEQGVTPSEITGFVERQQTLDDLNFGEEEARAVARELEVEGDGSLEERLERIARVVEEHGSLEEARSRLEKKVNSLKGSISSLEKRLEERKAEYRDVKEKMESCEEEIRELETKRDKLEGEIVELREEKEDAEGELQEMLKTTKQGEEIVEDLDEFESLEALVSSKEERADELDARVRSLEEDRERLRSSIDEVKESGVEQVKAAGDRVLEELESLEKNVERWGEIREKAGKLENELVYARYFLDDDDVLAQMPHRHAKVILDKLIQWCYENDIDMRVRAEDTPLYGTIGITYYTELDITSLLEAAKKALTGGELS